MFASLLVALLAAQPASSPLPPGPIPGQCTEPAKDNPGREGCYLAAELRIAKPPAQIYWHIFRFADETSARAEADRQPNSTVTFAHGKVWLQVLSANARQTAGVGERVATAGPMRLDPQRPITARFLESVFPPGMMTRTHTHSGPEAFYILDGVQCVETTKDKRMIRSGEVYVLDADIKHLQSSPSGRRSMALVFQLDDGPWMTLEPSWQPSSFCMSGNTQ